MVLSDAACRIRADLMASAFEIPREKVIGNFRVRKPKAKKPSADARRASEAPGYLDKIRSLPCAVCKAPPRSEAHHLRCTGLRGTGMKSPDRFALPLCDLHHGYSADGVHKVGTTREAAWFRHHGIFCLDLAAALHSNSQSIEAMYRVLEAHWSKS